MITQEMYEQLIQEIKTLNEKIDQQGKRLKVIEGYARNTQNIALSCESYSLDHGSNAYSEYELALYDRIHDLLHIMKPRKQRIFRIGRTGDGGYVMLDDYPEDYERIAYSFGISNDITFDSALADKEYHVYMYDHTIPGIKTNNERLHFFKLGISGSDGEMGGQCNSLEYYLKQNGHEHNKRMILKMDVEGAEWDFFKYVNAETLDSFDQIIMELHGFIDVKHNAEKIITGLETLNKTHQLIWLHRNNYGVAKSVGGRIYTNAFEVCYVNKSRYSFDEPDAGYCDMRLDYANWHMRVDYNMNYWN